MTDVINVDATQSKLSPIQEARLVAETEKFMAEKTAAEHLALLNDALAFQATEQGNRYKAESNRIVEEAKNMALQNTIVGLAAVQAQRSEEEEMAKDYHNHVYPFTSPITDASVKNCIQMLTQWVRKDPGCDIEILFNSPGGSMVDGLALYDFIQFVKSQGHKVTTSTLGMAASMAGVLLQAGDVRVMGAQSWLLIHESSFGVVGKMGDIEDTVNWVNKVQERIVDIFAERSKMTKTQIKNRWKRKDWWISSDEALSLGLIDEIR